MSNNSKQKEQALIQSIGDLVAAPENYDSFIKIWQEIIREQQGPSQATPDTFEQINKAAERALVALTNEDNSLSNTQRGPITLQRIEEPAFLLNANGGIVDLNDFAWERYRLDAGQSILDIPLEFFEPRVLHDALKQLAQTDQPNTSHSMVRCYDPATKTTSTVMLVTMRSDTALDSQLLLIVNTGKGAEQSARLLTDGCGLTQMENALLFSFLKGRTLTDIAEQRNRSLPTIRNQMQSILSKTGCNSQSELMRLSFSLSDLMASLLPVIEDSQRANRTELAFLRPDGRIVDVTVTGAKQGRLVISLPSIFGHCSTPQLEAAQFEAGIKMVSVALPGMGKTDVAPMGVDLIDCIAGDIQAVVQQLQADDFILLGRASTSSLIFQLCARMPDRISKAIVVNGVFPATFVDDDNVAGSWARSLMNASMKSESVAKLILRSGRRLMRMIGAKAFLRQMYAKSPSDVAILNDPHVIKSIEQGVQMVTHQGFDAGSHDMTRAFWDWTDTVKDCPKQVTLIQGTEDPNVPIQTSRTFALRFPDQCELIEINGGGLLSFSHVEPLIEQILARRELSEVG
ncbi:hypothetical protein L0666_02395 [Octadecabacter sp. CECT 8868]|uniref:hypothetical protein n=1 Tax=Octadecabacter algicola TaxID=2909342 RepID=UPI001F302ECD|nr:hypothetical protein [Octadecabacter algicola]MCF2903824.1 hypothetical protein [Octadecabacter algicola]